MQRLLTITVGILALGMAAPTRQPKPDTPRKDISFKWMNDFPKGKYPGLQHGTFRSPSNNAEVGYCIYLPPGYDDGDNKSRRYPVVYWLHGGRPGGETKAIGLTSFFDSAMRKGQTRP